MFGSAHFPNVWIADFFVVYGALSETIFDFIIASKLGRWIKQAPVFVPSRIGCSHSPVVVTFYRIAVERRF